MYIRTQRAYCWREDIAAELAPSRLCSSHPTDLPIRWARRPWPTRVGSLVAVRLLLGEVQVAVRVGSHLRWMAAGTVLTPREAHRWASSGF